MELDDDHPFAAGRIADDDVAQEACLLTEVKERQAVIHGVVANVVTYLVLQVIHQPAFLNRQNFVECACNVKANGGHIF